MAISVPGRSATGKSPGVRVVVPLLVGAAVSVALGAYGGAHAPTGRSVTTFGFSSVLTMKVWLTTAAAALALVQLGTALRSFGHLGTGTTPRWFLFCTARPAASPSC